ncbi:MAG: hypothetical protein MUP17_09950 [candidate division Zixibacteria bacterium]|nr:hypothetical protein [candidate division Zixibacteria bacterium]
MREMTEQEKQKLNESTLSMLRICSSCGLRFASPDGRDKKCWECQGYEKPPVHYYVYDEDGLAIEKLIDAKGER